MRALSTPTATRSLQHINETVSAAIAAGEPVISVDAKKRELVGDFKAVGREFEPKGRPVEVRGHDFKDKQLGHAIPYGVYDLAADEGWVWSGSPQRHRAVRGQHDHQLVGAPRQGPLPERHDADDHRRLRRVQQPPHPAVALRAAAPRRHDRAARSASATSRREPRKWNKIEHRMFSFVSLNWRGKPLESLEVIINLIAATTNEHRTEDLRPPRRPQPTNEASTSPTNNSPPSTSPDTHSTATGTTPSSLH